MVFVQRFISNVVVKKKKTKKTKKTKKKKAKQKKKRNKKNAVCCQMTSYFKIKMCYNTVKE